MEVPKQIEADPMSHLVPLDRDRERDMVKNIRYSLAGKSLECTSELEQT